MTQFAIYCVLIQKKITVLFVLLLLVAQGAYLRNNLFFNLGQLGRVHKNTQLASLLITSLRGAPNNNHIRLQAATFLAEEGNFTRSIDLLMPLVNTNPVYPETIPLLFNLLVAHDRSQEAWAILQKIRSPKSLLTPGVAAEFVRLSKEGVIQASPDTLYLLLTKVFSLDPSSIEIKETFEQKLKRPYLWSTDIGAKLSEGIIWRSNSLKFISSVMVVDDISCDLANLALNNSDLFTESSKNQVSNGNFEDYNILFDIPSQWKLQFASTGNPWNVGGFIIGVDLLYPISGLSSLRVDSLLVEWKPERENARANVISSPVIIEPDSTYVFCFIYRTDNTEDYIASFLPTENYTVFHQQDFFLPPTQKKTNLVTIILHSNITNRTTISPLFRIWKEGSIWIDDFSIQKITLITDKGVSLPIYQVDAFN